MSPEIRGRATAAVGLVVMILVLAIGGVIGREAGRVTTRAIFGDTNPDVLSRPWTTYEVAGLSVEALSPFVAQLQMPEVSEAVMEFVETYEFHTTEIGTVNVSVSRATYRDGVDVSVEGAAQNAAQESARAMGMRDFSYSYEETRVDDLSGLFSRYSVAAEGGGTIEGRSLTFRRGQTVWQVQVLFLSTPNGHQIAARVLESVRFPR